MKCRGEQRQRPGRRRRLLSVALISLATRPLLVHAAAAASAAATATATTSSTTTTLSSADRRPRDRTVAASASSFFEKFETHGPTLTLTLRDPSSTMLLADGNVPPKRISSSAASADALEDGTGGFSSKLAGIFRIGSSSSANGQTVNLSPQRIAKNARLYADGYMLDDGEIYLDPPSSTTGDDGISSSSRGLFSMRGMGNAILGGRGSTLALSECVRDVHPEVRFEMRTRERRRERPKPQQQPFGMTDDDDDDNANDDIDTRPFPSAAPWLSSLSCGAVWTPFPTYKQGEGFGHKLMSVPHFVRCGATLSLPRISAMIREWRSTSRGISNTFTLNDDGGPRMKELNLGATYRDNPYSADGGSLELLLGRSRSTLSPAWPIDEDNGDPHMLHSSRKGRMNNHVLVRLANLNRRNKPSTNHNASPNLRNSLLSSIQYAKASFRLPTPFFWPSKRVLVSPSFDFGTGEGRCVFSGDVGKSGRTRAVLRLSEDDSTLTFVRALDDR